MYEEHIETLNAVREFTVNPRWHMAADAAIELFRAAQPKDEAAERALAEREVAEAQWGDTYETAVDRVVRLRAAARLECHIELCCLRKDVADWKQRATDLADRLDPRMCWPTPEERLREQLAAAQAEIERVTRAYEAERVAAIDAFNSARAWLEAELAAAQAEIERLKVVQTEFSQLSDSFVAQQNQLSGLCAAAERVCEENWKRKTGASREAIEALRAAAEASTK